MVDDILSEIKRCEIDEKTIIGFESEYDFMQLSVDLTIRILGTLPIFILQKVS
jgi:hypothetical protein